MAFNGLRDRHHLRPGRLPG